METLGDVLLQSHVVVNDAINLFDGLFVSSENPLDINASSKSSRKLRAQNDANAEDAKHQEYCEKV